MLRFRSPEFWPKAAAALRLSSLRVPDHRRDVVHVMDVYEARQWELPVVFVCGLIEKQFPKYHAQNPLLPDAARRKLNQDGLRLATSAEQQAEECYLFDVATSRATELQVLSYAKCNAKGDENLRSFFLEERACGARIGAAGASQTALGAARDGACSVFRCRCTRRGVEAA